MRKRTKHEPAAPEKEGPAPDETTADWLEYYGTYHLDEYYRTDCKCYCCRVARSWYPRWLANRAVEERVKREQDV